MGVKTVNAKTKAFQTPAPTLKDNAPKDGAPKDAQSAPKSTARKPKPRISHAEMTKVEVFSGDNELPERDIEYMPPPAKGKPSFLRSWPQISFTYLDLPNEPDDLPELNLSMLADGNLTRGCLAHFLNEPDSTGLSYAQRRVKEHEEYLAKLDKQQDALDLRELESTPFFCLHEPRCPPDLCKDNAEARKAAEAKYRKTLAELGLLPKDKAPPQSVKEQKIAPKGPSLATAKRAAASLSQPKPPAFGTTNATALKPTTTNLKAQTPKSSTSLLKSRKKTPPPTNPSSMRATAATVASRQTIGYSKGRSTSSNLRTAFPAQTKKATSTPMPTRALKKRETTLPPGPKFESLGEMEPREYVARYGLPEYGTEMWFWCRALGYFNEDKEDGKGKGEDVEGKRGVEDWFRGEAERDFVFVLQDEDDDEGKRKEEDRQEGSVKEVQE